MQKRMIIVSYKDEFELRMDSYIAGVYFLVVRDVNGRVISTIKLEKMY